MYSKLIYMKRLFYLLAFVFLFQDVWSQDLPNFREIKLEKREDYDNDANMAALKASNYLFSCPMDENDVQRLLCLQYVLKWTMGTPDYTFYIDENTTRFAKGNSELLPIYMAAMTKFVLENKVDSKNEKK